MADENLLRRKSTTAPPSEFFSDGSLAGGSMPADMVDQIRGRVRAIGVVTAGLWSFSLIMNAVVAPLLGRPALFEDLWPKPNLPVAIAGLLLSLLLIFLSQRVRRSQLLLDLSAGFMILFCLLGGILSQWHPPPISPRVSWLCILIIAYPAIVPTTVKRTLVVSLIAATMDPVGLFIAWLRGATFEPSAMYFLWDFLPTYLAALISVVPAKVIRRLSQQVMKARELGSYRLEEVLGKGGMGEVYRASHQMLARPAAVKLIRAEVLGESSADRARTMIERFRREAQASASLRSPHTINLYDFGVSQDGTFFLVMEMLEGLDLETLVERYGPQSAERAVYLLSQACESLAEAHAKGLIHRDIKPSNIFVCRMGLAVDFVKVLDFGLVKSLGTEKQNTMLTAPDAMAGTPAFMPPEVVLNKGVMDHRMDIYALGCVAYWLLTGRLVFEAPNPMQVMIQHANAVPQPPSSRVELPIPPALDEVVLACLAKDPLDRPATATDVAERLQQAIGQGNWSQTQAHRWWELHRPETAKPASISVGGLTLEKALN